MEVIRDHWVGEGIRPERVTTTGMPVNLSLFEPVDRAEFLTSKGLDPKIKTIVLASGGEGVGNFPLIVEQVSKEVSGPLQIIAVCAKNEKHVQNLNKLKASLRSGVRLEVHGMVPNADLLSYIKSSDLFITKSGGLSPTEGFAINKPMVILDVYGGHERDNADLFEKEGLAVVNRDQRTIGRDVRKVLDNPELQESMLRAQLGFRNSFNLEAITDFAFDSRRYLDVESFQLGLEASRPVANTAETLKELERHSPSDIEILLSYPKSYSGTYFGPSNNPFGHLAVRVGDKVYTANGKAQPGVEPMLIIETSLQEYLYGTERPIQNIEMTDAFGSAYGRDNISLRVKGLSPEAMAAMHAEVATIQAQWRAGETKWTARHHNCADFVLQILQAGGVKTTESLNWRNAKHITMPLDVFETYRTHFSGRGDMRSEMVIYEHVPGSANIYKAARFPLSIHQIKRSVRNILFRNIDPVEILSGKRVKIVGETTKAVALVNVNGESATRDHALRPADAAELARVRSEISALETELAEVRRNVKVPAGPQIQNTHELYQQKLNDIRSLELRLLLKSTWSVVVDLRAELSATYDHAALAKLDKHVTAARQHYNSYFETESGTQRLTDDSVRADSAEKFVAEVKQFFTGAEAAKFAPVTVSFWQKLKVRSAQIYRRVRSVLTMTPTVLRGIVTYWTKPDATLKIEGEAAKSAKSAKRPTQMTELQFDQVVSDLYAPTRQQMKEGSGIIRTCPGIFF